MSSTVYQAERIMKKRVNKGVVEYFVKWKGWSKKDSTWEPEKHILDRALIHIFEQRQRGKHLHKKGSKKKNDISQIEKDKPTKATKKARSKFEIKNEEEDDAGESGPGISSRLQEEADHEDALQTGMSEEKERRRPRPKVTASEDVGYDKRRDSSDNTPLQRKHNEALSEKSREATGTKRKAEVLSTESGKIGVTITTSPSVSSHPPCKKVKGSTYKRSNSKITGKKSKQNLKSLKKAGKVLFRRPSTKPGKENTVTRNINQEQATIIRSSDAAFAREDDSKQKKGQQPQETNTLSERDIPMSNQVAKTDDKVNNNVNDVSGLVKSQIITHHGADYWIARNPVADQVFITDVTVNLQTVTIRECKTEKRFFKEREHKEQSADIK